MGTYATPAPRLGFWWVVRRELEIQARPSERTDYSYRGLWRPLVFAAMLLLPALWSEWPSSGAFSHVDQPPTGMPLAPYLLVLCLYALYRAHAAACLGAGSLRDTVALRHAGVSPGAVLAAKLVASLLPLWVELVVLAPLFGWAMMDSGCPWSRVVLAVGLLALQTVGFGLVGMAFSTASPASWLVDSGVRQFVWLLLYSPLVVLAPIGLSPDGNPRHLAAACLALVNPAAQLYLTVGVPWDSHDPCSVPFAGLSTLGVGVGLVLMLVLGLHTVRAISIRLE